MTYRMATVSLLLLALVAAAGPASATEGRAWGDIHLRTMDGTIYDFQSSGEFVASRSPDGDFEVQLRLETNGFAPHVSVATAVAVQVDATRASVVLGRDPLLYVDERPVDLASGDALDLPWGGRIERRKKDYEIYWADGSILTVDVRKRHLNAYLRPSPDRRGTLTGLFGNFNGVSGDDVSVSTVALGAAPTAGIDPVLAEAARMLFSDGEEPWTIAQQESLFEYEPGKTTWSYRKPKPRKEATVDGLSKSRRKSAREACEAAGVTDPDLLEACIVDVGYTRDASFAETAAAVQERDDVNWDEEPVRRADAGR
jgi:hypothetical protein